MEGLVMTSMESTSPVLVLQDSRENTAPSTSTTVTQILVSTTESVMTESMSMPVLVLLDFLEPFVNFQATHLRDLNHSVPRDHFHHHFIFPSESPLP